MNDNEKEFYEVTINIYCNNSYKITSIRKIKSTNKPSNTIIHKASYDIWIDYFNNEVELKKYIEYIYFPLVNNHQSLDSLLCMLPVIG